MFLLNIQMQLVLKVHAMSIWQTAQQYYGLQFTSIIFLQLTMQGKLHKICEGYSSIHVIFFSLQVKLAPKN